MVIDVEKVTAERERLAVLLDRADVPKQKRDVLAAVIDNISWQRVKLDEARERMQDEAIVCTYNNGGGQFGERENPIFKAYINLFRAYMIGLEKFTSYLPKDFQEEATEAAISTLDMVKKMRAAR